MENLLALHRYFIWSNRLREYFDIALGQNPTGATESPEAYFVNDVGVFLSYWYAALFVVVEGWRELRLSDTEIDGLLSSPNIELLRRYRHGVCHFQANYFDARFTALLAAQNVVPWVRQLHLALGRYFLDRLGQQSVRRS